MNVTRRVSRIKICGMLRFNKRASRKAAQLAQHEKIPSHSGKQSEQRLVVFERTEPDRKQHLSLHLNVQMKALLYGTSLAGEAQLPGHWLPR